MYVYREMREHNGGPRFFQVGFYRPTNGDHQWEAESDHPDRDAARKHINFLNGGQSYEMLHIKNMELINEAVRELAARVEVGLAKPKHQNHPTF